MNRSIKNHLLLAILAPLAMSSAATANGNATLDFGSEAYHLSINSKTGSYRINAIEIRNQSAFYSLTRKGSWSCDESETAYRNNEGKIPDFIYQDGTTLIRFDILKIFNKPQEFKTRLKALASQKGIDDLNHQTLLRINQIEITPILSSQGLLHLADKGGAAVNYLNDSVAVAVAKINQKHLNDWDGSFEIPSYAAYCDLQEGRLGFEVRLNYTLVTQELSESKVFSTESLTSLAAALRTENRQLNQLNNSVSQIVAKSRHLEKVLSGPMRSLEPVDDQTFLSLWHLFYETPEAQATLNAGKIQSFLYNLSEKTERRIQQSAQFRTLERNQP